MFKIIVLISGNGSNLQAIIDACKSGIINGNVVGVISNRDDAFGLERAKKDNIPSKVINHNNYNTRIDFDQKLVSTIKKLQPDLVVLAGFMRILSEDFVNNWFNKQINIHPSLLPNFKGLDVHKRVIESKTNISGCTVHLVRAGVDEGPIIAQESFRIKPGMTLKQIVASGQPLEARALVKGIKLYLAKRLDVHWGVVKQV